MLLGLTDCVQKRIAVVCSLCFFPFIVSLSYHGVVAADIFSYTILQQLAANSTEKKLIIF